MCEFNCVISLEHLTAIGIDFGPSSPDSQTKILFLKVIEL